MPSADVELVRRAYEALNQGDPDPLAALFGPDPVWRGVQRGFLLFTAPGRHGVRFEDLGRSVPNVPDRTARSGCCAYRLVEAGEAFTSVEIGELACRI